MFRGTESEKAHSLRILHKKRSFSSSCLNTPPTWQESSPIIRMKKKKDTAVVPTGPMERVTKPVESELEKGKGNKRNISQGIILVGLNS